MRDQTLAAGGNLLINIGPMADGTIPPEQVRALVG
jgi:alpha-L-fucosidase